MEAHHWWRTGFLELGRTDVGYFLRTLRNGGNGRDGRGRGSVCGRSRRCSNGITSDDLLATITRLLRRIVEEASVAEHLV